MQNIHSRQNDGQPATKARDSQRVGWSLCNWWIRCVWLLAIVVVGAGGVTAAEPDKPKGDLSLQQQQIRRDYERFERSLLEAAENMRRKEPEQSDILDRARHRPPLTESERTEANRVKGCISQAWIVADCRDGLCHFRCDADSPLVRGLLVLLCDFYSEATPAEVAATEPSLLEALGVAHNLSPTRLNGLRSVRAKIRDYALAQTRP